MNFAVKEIDIFEKSTKGGKTSLRIVDAKFALPSGGKKDQRDEGGFVCLDLLDYPSEHSDITIGFESDNGRSTLLNLFMTNADIYMSLDYEKFSQALPAPVRIK